MRTDITFDHLGLRLVVFRDVRKAFIHTLEKPCNVPGMFRRLPNGALDYFQNPNIPDSRCPAEVLHVLGSMI